MSASTPHKRFATSALGVLVARVVACLSAFGFTAVLAQTLSPAEFGAFVLLFSFATLATVVGSLGLNRAMVKWIAEAEGCAATQRRVVRRGLLIGSVGGIVSSIVAGLLLKAFGSRIGVTDSLTPVLFGFMILLRTVHVVLAESARGFHEKAWSNMFGGPAGGPVPHLVFLIGLLGVLSVSSCDLATALLIYVVAFAVTLPTLFWRVLTMEGINVAGSTPLNEQSFSTCMALALPLMLTQVGALAMAQADIWLAGGLISVEDLAVYGAAQRLLAFLSIPLQIAGTAIVSYIPQFQVRHDKVGLQSMVSLAAGAAGAPGIVLGIVFLLFPAAILRLVFGDFYAAGSVVLVVLSIGQIVCILTGPCDLLLMMTGHHRKSLAVNTTATAALFVVAPFATQAWGVLGLAVSMATVTATQNLVNCYLAHRCVGVNTAFSLQPLAAAFETLRTKRAARTLS